MNSVLVSLKAAARVVAAKVAEAVRVVEAGPRHLHLETVALIGRIATNLH